MLVASECGKRLIRNSLVIEFVAFSYIGIEVVGVTAYEARDLKDLRRPSKTIGYIVLLMYIIHTFSEIMVVNWNDPRLNVISNDVGQTTPVFGTQTFPILDVAAQKANDTGLAGAFTGLLIYSSWSASNISLYIASRTLYGLVRGVSYRGPPVSPLSASPIMSYQESDFQKWSWIRKEFGTGVPAWCVILSVRTEIN